MTEINIILDTNFEETNDNTKKNDKEIFYELLDKDLGIYNLNSYNKYKIPYNQILEDLLFNDNYLDYENEISNISSINIKKLLLKKILTYYNPIIKTIINTKKSKIIDKNAINLNFSIDGKIVSQENKYISMRLSSNTYFTLHGIYNNNNLHSNLPYKSDNYKYIHKLIPDLLKPMTIKFLLYSKSLNYKNIGFLDIIKIDNDKLKCLYNLYMHNNSLYLNNVYLSEKYIKININNINQYNNKKLVNTTYSKEYISYFNKFLSYKINDYFNNHSYYAFQTDNLLNLYEEILIYSLDNNNIQNKINILLNKQNQIKNYFENKAIINKYNLKYIQLELLTRKKFPNLFNINSKDVLFNKYKKFNLDDLPKKYKEIILIEYKKLQNLTYKNLNNNCKHKNLIKNLNIAINKYPIIQDIIKLIKGDINKYDSLYECILCSYTLICPHIVEYYNLIFSKKESNNEFSIRQHIINKYMSNSKINMIYYCKICGEELGKSLELEQNVEYKDNVKLNTYEYTDSTLEMIRNNVSYIIYSYITFTSLNMSLTKKYLINYIINLISSHINTIEKSLRKSKIYNEDQIINILDFNIIIFIYATIIYIMTKYPSISFRYETSSYIGKNEYNKNIIISKKIEIKSNKDLLNLIKIRFKEAYNLIVSTNHILLFKLKYNKQLDKIKEILIKTYGIVSKNDQLLLSDNNIKMSNKKLLEFSNIYKYYYFILSVYNNYSIDNKNKSSLSFSNIKNNLLSGINNIKFNEYEKVLNLQNININTLNNLFDKFKSSIINEQLINKILQKKEILDYNEYKIVSFNLFYMHIKYEFYNLPIYEYISSNTTNTILPKYILDNIYNDNIKDNINDNIHIIFNKYLKLSKIVKIYEIKLINANIQFNLYPFSLLKLNNSRYFQNIDIKLNVFFCSNDGFPHKFNIYMYKNNNKQIEIYKKDIDKNIEIINQSIFIDHKCSKCNLTKNYLLNTKVSNIDIIKLITENNDKNGFFNLYLNICPIMVNNKEYQFHKFNYETDYTNIICDYCKIKYSDLLDKNNNIYLKFYKEYEDYKLKIKTNINNKLLYLNTKINTDLKININDIYNNKINNIDLLNISSNVNIIDYLNNINYDTLLVEFSQKFNINLIFLQKLGLTEGIIYDEKNLNSLKETFTILRINKLMTYFRTIIIYYNLIKYHYNNFTFNDREFLKIINQLKENSIFQKNYNKSLPIINYNLSDLLILLKLNYSNEIITKYLIKLILQFILEFNRINTNKFNNQLDIVINYMISKILKYDELFTNYNYNQLKQMFIEDQQYYINNTLYDNETYDNEDDDDLFGYNDLNINFEDEDPLE